MLTKPELIGCMPVRSPTDPDMKLMAGQGEQLNDHNRYMRLMGKLNYLTDIQGCIALPIMWMLQ